MMLRSLLASSSPVFLQILLCGSVGGGDGLPDGQPTPESNGAQIWPRGGAQQSRRL